VAKVAGKTAADDAKVTVEFSSDLVNWQSQGAVYLGSSREGLNTTLRHWRAPLPSDSATPPRYARLVLKTAP
jgi:hypothetical protein